MNIKKFNMKDDYDRVIEFLRDNYKENNNIVSWLPQRFDDLIFRVDTLHHDERGLERSADYTFIFESDDGEIIGLLVPDGDSAYTCIKNGHEELFSTMVDLGEQELQPLFKVEEDGTINFLVVSHDSLEYQRDELLRRGYVRDEAGDYDNLLHPLETNYVITLPEGYKQVFGENINDGMKSTACHYGFSSEVDDGNLLSDGENGSLSYQGRKKSQFYKDSFESMIMTDDGDICSYCFIYVDKDTSTAFFEPVCTREKYRHMGFAREMLHGAINRLKEMGIKDAYVNSYDWRVKVYNGAGFNTIDTIGCWHKKIKKR